VRRLRVVSVVVVGVLAVVAAAVASGRVLRVLRAAEHPAAVAHPRFVRGAAERSALAPGAAAGGRVIVVLKQKNSHVSLAHGLASRRAVDAAQQAPIVASIRQSGGSHIRGLTLVNAVAAQVSAKEARHLATLSDASQVIPDQQVTETVPLTATTNNVERPRQQQQVCPASPNHPLVEPEALEDMHFEGPGPDEADTIADGTGVVVAIDGMNELAGNPNFTRPNGQHVVEDAPDYNPADIPNDGSLDEWFGDASSVAAQGTVVYDYSKELPFSSLPTGCTFVIKGDAPGATLADLSLVDPSATITTENGIQMVTTTQSTSSIVAGMENAITLLHADVISQSYGSGGGSNTLFAADDAAVAAGVTVVASSGDEGFDNTFISPADDPNVIGVGATNTLRLLSQAYGFKGWVNDNITTLSSTGTGQPFSSPSAPGKYVDLVAPGYGGEAACSPLVTAGCPQPTPGNPTVVTGLTEAFGGTSESAPFVAGAAADVIEAYRNTHGGTSPTPAMVQQILDGTATDIDAPAGEQGAGLVNIYAAVRAAEEMPGTTLRGDRFGFGESHGALISTPTQLDVSGNGGQTVPEQLSVYNASSSFDLVTAWLRELGPAYQLDPTVTESISAPPASAPVPADGAQAAPPVRFYVPRGVDHLNANMIWPDPTNSNILYYILFDPQGRVVQVSYDYGTGPTRTGVTIGTVPNIQHTEVSDPTPGLWTAQILWGNGRSHLQEPPNVPGTYTGTMSFQVTGQNYRVFPAGTGFTRIPGRSSGTVNVRVPLATAPGDSGLSVQLRGSNGATASVPVLRRTFIPSTGGPFQATMGTSVGRNQGSPNSLFFINVPAGEQSMEVALNTADANADNPYTYELFDPNGNEVVADATPTTTVVPAPNPPVALANLSVANPIPGEWEIVVVLNLTTSGNEFSQVINGDVRFNNSGVSVVSGLPTSTSTTLAQGTAQPVVLNVTNTLGVGRTYTFSSNQPDIASVSAYIPAGATQQVTLPLTPTAAPGTVVSGLLAVTAKTSAAASRRNPNINVATLAVLPSTYTVGTPAP
jgi:Subtilase family